MIEDLAWVPASLPCQLDDGYECSACCCYLEPGCRWIRISGRGEALLEEWLSFDTDVELGVASGVVSRRDLRHRYYRQEWEDIADGTLAILEASRTVWELDALRDELKRRYPWLRSMPIRMIPYLKSLGRVRTLVENDLLVATRPDGVRAADLDAEVRSSVALRELRAAIERVDMALELGDWAFWKELGPDRFKVEAQRACSIPHRVTRQRPVFSPLQPFVREPADG